MNKVIKFFEYGYNRAIILYSIFTHTRIICSVQNEFSYMNYIYKHIRAFANIIAPTR